MYASPEPTLRHVLESKGLKLRVVEDGEAALALVEREPPRAVVLDLALSGGMAWELVSELKGRAPELRIVLLVGDGSIFSVIEAMRRGATEYLLAPIESERLLAAVNAGATSNDAARPRFPTLERMQWEYIQTVLGSCGGNVSEAARQLGVHRQSLQRKLRRHAPRS
jgi:two-component system, response regulator RegA